MHSSGSPALPLAIFTGQSCSCEAVRIQWCQHFCLCAARRGACGPLGNPEPPADLLLPPAPPESQCGHQPLGGVFSRGTLSFQLSLSECSSLLH